MFSDGNSPFDIHTNSFSENRFLKVSVSTVFNEETASSSIRMWDLVRSFCFFVCLRKLMSSFKHCLNSAR